MLFLKNYFILCSRVFCLHMCLCVPCACMGLAEVRKRPRSPGTGIADSHEASYGYGEQNQVLGKSNHCSQQLSHFSSPI